MPTWLQIAEAVGNVAGNPLWEFLIPLLVAPFLKLLSCFGRLRRRGKLLAQIVDLAQLQPFLSEAPSVLGSLDTELLREIMTIIAMDVERYLPPFRFAPDYYNPRSSLYRLRVDVQYLERTLSLLQDSAVSFIINNIVDELCLLLSIFRRMQLARNEIRSFEHQKQRYWDAIEALQADKERVREQLRKLVADYALLNLDAKLTNETALQSLDMEDFHNRCERYAEYREVVLPERQQQ